MIEEAYLKKLEEAMRARGMQCEAEMLALAAMYTEVMRYLDIMAQAGDPLAALVLGLIAQKAESLQKAKAEQPAPNEERKTPDDGYDF